jgi:ABC-2 type transport system permease protein
MHIGLIVLSSQIFMVSLIVGSVYLLDCLYAERKDRSILFWKSLPVSDARTVLVKYAVAMLIVPLGVFVLCSVLFPVLFGIASLGFNGFDVLTGGWNTIEWLKAELALLSLVVANLLWFAPAAAWAMLASVLSRRSPILLAGLPPVVLAVSENIVLQSSEVWKFLGRRLSPVLDLAEAGTRPSLWIGLAVAAGILYIVIRLRRYRDDT